MELQHLNIFEMNYSVSPGGVDEWEVHNEDGSVAGSFLSLIEAVNYAYKLGADFTVHTLAAWELRYGSV